LNKNKTKYFFLAHGVMGLECLKGLIKNNYSPESVVVHKDFELGKKYDDFYMPIENLCKDNGINLIKAGKLNEYKNNFEGFDFGICVGFMEIIKNDILGIPKLGIFNLHCGKLPQYRGRAPISRTIMDGNEFLTMTLHKMDEGVDSGEILLEQEIKIETDDDVNTMYGKCCEESSDVIFSGIEKINNGELVLKKQDLSLKPKANKKISGEERIINWNDNITKIHNLIRAITPPYPCAYSTYESNIYKFVKSEIFSIETCNARNTGEIYFVDEDYFLINCVNGLLKITEIRDADNYIIKPEEVFKQRGIFK
jgi:methionyl-tRNA formyltransferase